MHPHAGKQAIIDTMRIIGIFLYLTDMCMKIAYFNNTKWISGQMSDLYE